ncbi:hypothetical protein ABI59_13025 [Acidobacteria bacterium Mor1]|nr:hypothetical protein ABI59_13025 [Acidobacteria bacterium Mor1]
MESERVVITGVGVVSPIGTDRESFWQACLAGRSGAVSLENPAVAGLSSRIGSPIMGFEPKQQGVPARQVSLLDRTTHFGLAAAHEALTDAGFELTPSAERRDQLVVEGVDPWRLGSSLGSGIGGITTLEQTHANWIAEHNRTHVKRYALPMLIPNAVAGQIAIRFGARAECKALSTACAAGTMALGEAWRSLSRGEADVMIAGGAEGVAGDHDGYCMMGFDRLKTMSVRNDDPTRASRPFDKDRDGFVIGEGSAILVLERESFARARGARIYGAISGYASNCDAHSMMQIDDTGVAIRRLIESALATAGMSVDDVDHVNAHGTSTLLNDRTEAKVFRELFGARAGEVTVTAVKSMTGHGIGASGPMESAALSLSMQRGVITPTINYETPDPDAEVNLVANTPLESRPQLAIKTSYGFGGHNACLVFSAV